MVMRMLSSVIALVRVVGDGSGVLRVLRMAFSAERSSGDMVVLMLVLLDRIGEVDV